LSSTTFRIKAVQLDLARHMESVDFIKRYADMIAGEGFNTLALYLEGRVRTPSFPYRSAAESYTLDQMGEVVAHARGLGIDVVPIVSTLGHCEHFLGCPELRHLSETRGGQGRFGPIEGGGSVVCPSLEATSQFFERYLAELAGVFTGPWMHVGMDEAFDLGVCELCRARWVAQGLSAVFMPHLHRIHRMVSALGKRMWMWDDMFELFPGEIHNLPKDIVLCHWNYDQDIQAEGSQANLVDRFRQDCLGEYERLGLDALVCPWDRYPWNIETISLYARRHKVLGGLLGQWEISPRLFPPAQPLLVAFCGALWDESKPDVDDAWRLAISKTIPGATNELTTAVRAALEPGFSFHRAASNPHHSGFPSKEERLRQRELELAGIVILDERRKGPVSDDGIRTLDVLEWAVRMEHVHGECRALAPAIRHPRRPVDDIPMLSRRLDAVEKELAELHAWRMENSGRLEFLTSAQDEATGRQFRPEALLAELRRRISETPVAADWLLILRLYLTDFFSAPRLTVTILAGCKEQTLVSGCFKPQDLIAGRTGGHYDWYVSFRSESIPEAIRLEGGGYGGQGVAYLEIQNLSTTLKPSTLRRTEGHVTHPEAALRDSSSVAMLGLADTLTQIHDPGLIRSTAVLEITLQQTSQQTNE